MKPNAPWIDPTAHGLETQLHPGSFHLVYLMSSKTDEFILVTPNEFRQTHSTPDTYLTTNMLAISIEKRDVEGVCDDGRVQIKSLPRIKIQVDSVFVSLDDLTQKAKDAFVKYFKFV